MGLFSMLNFISGAAATGLIGKLLDSGSAGVRLNPLLLLREGTLYSNIFLSLAAGTVLVALLYLAGFRKSGRPAGTGMNAQPAVKGTPRG
ncbi:hypothetical protein D3C81_2132650 [compost metagenome]